MILPINFGYEKIDEKTYAKATHNHESTAEK